MAGSIFISKEIRLPLSTQQFDYLTERIRGAFYIEDQSHLRSIYTPMDDEGTNFISAENEEKTGFKAFFKAIARAKSNAQLEENYKIFGQLWDELLNKVRSDPRFSAEWEDIGNTAKKPWGTASL